MKETQLPVIHVDLLSHENGTFNAYLSDDNSSGAKYDNISPAEIGQRVTEMVCDLDHALTGTEHTAKQPCFLIYTDGYKVDKRDFNDKDTACRAMEKEYWDLYNAAFGETGMDSDNTSYISEYEADLYTDTDVHLWRIFNA